MWGTIQLAIASGMISFIISEAKIFLPLRQWIKPRSKFFYDLISCGLCLSVWIAAFEVIIFQPNLFEGFLGYVFTVFVIAYLSAIFWLILNLLLNICEK